MPQSVEHACKTRCCNWQTDDLIHPCAHTCKDATLQDTLIVHKSSSAIQAGNRKICLGETTGILECIEAVELTVDVPLFCPPPLLAGEPLFPPLFPLLPAGEPPFAVGLAVPALLFSFAPGEPPAGEPLLPGEPPLPGDPPGE